MQWMVIENGVSKMKGRYDTSFADTAATGGSGSCCFVGRPYGVRRDEIWGRYGESSVANEGGTAGTDHLEDTLFGPLPQYLLQEHDCLIQFQIIYGAPPLPPTLDALVVGGIQILLGVPTCQQPVLPFDGRYGEVLLVPTMGLSFGIKVFQADHVYQLRLPSDGDGGTGRTSRVVPHLVRVFRDV
jgi:hypothetical protein